MFALLTIIALSIGQVTDNDVRVNVPATPFECAHARSFCFDQAGRRLICTTQRGELLVWNDDLEIPIVTNLERKPGGQVFDQSPMSAVLTSRGTEVALFYLDGRVQVWRIETGVKLKDLECDRKSLSYARSSPDGEFVACLSHDHEKNTGALLFWNTRDWTTAGRIETGDRINDYCFSADGRLVFACVGHPTDQKNLGFTGILAWDFATRQEQGRIEFGTGFPIRIAVSADGRWVATGGGDAVPSGPNARSLSGHLRIFDWEGKKFHAEPYTLDRDYVRVVQFSPDSRTLYSGSSSVSPERRNIAAIRAFRVSGVRRLWIPLWEATLGNGNPHELSVSPNGKDILVPDSGKLQVVDAGDGTVRGSKLAFRFYPEDRNAEKPK